MKRKSRLILLYIALGILLTTAVGIMSGLAPSLLPEPIIHYFWPLLGIVILLLIGVTVLQHRLQSEMESSTKPLSGQNRQHLIAKVRAFWITGFLEQSLHGVALIALGLQSQPDVLDNPWHLILQQADQSVHILVLPC